MKYEVQAKLVFSGKFYIEAKDAAQAKELVQKQCGMTTKGGIESSLNEDVCDWDFDPHAETVAGRVRKVK
jgi:hypothetical protein